MAPAKQPGNDVGSGRTMPDKLKTISKEECAEICSILSKLKIVSDRAQSDDRVNAPALVDSLADDFGADTLTPDEQENIIRNWMEIDDDPNIIEAEIKDAINELELTGVPAADQELESDESESDEDDEDTEMNIRSIFEAESMIGDIVTYCRRRKFKDDVIRGFEKMAKKIRNVHIESRANGTQRYPQLPTSFHHRKNSLLKSIIRREFHLSLFYSRYVQCKIVR
jgi:hypothetical protein